MRLIIEDDFKKLSKRAAKIIANAIIKKPDLVLGLATGSTPLGTYKELIKMYNKENLDFSQVVTFNLDEYYNISQDDKNSYNYYMHENLFKHINIKEENINIPKGNVKEIKDYCKEYDKKIKKCGGIDLQLLGIGNNGHIGFNEPDKELNLRTHLTKLTKSTIEANARFFNSIKEVPDRAITMGLSSIMNSKKILLLASGKNKTNIIEELLTKDKATTEIPASALLMHSNLTVILDEDAACNYKKRMKKGEKDEIIN